MLHVCPRNSCGTEPHVALDRAREEERILQHNSELPPQFLQIKQADIDSIQQNLPALNIVKAQQQGDQRGFSGARMADDREGLPRSNAERDVAQHPILVGEFARLACS